MGQGDGIAISDLSSKARAELKEAGVNTGRDNNPNDLSANDVAGALADKAGLSRKNIAQKIAQALVEAPQAKRDKIISEQTPAIASELTTEVAAAKERQQQIGSWIECTGSEGPKLSNMNVSPTLVAQLKRVAELGYRLNLEGGELSIIGPVKSMSMWVEARGQEGMSKALERYLKTVKDIRISDAAAKILDKDNAIAVTPNGVIDFIKAHYAQGFKDINYINQLELFNGEGTKRVEISVDKKGRLNLDVELDTGTHEIYTIDHENMIVINESTPKLEVNSQISAKLNDAGIEIRDNKIFFPEGYVYYQDRAALKSNSGIEPDYIDPFSMEGDNGEDLAAVTSAVLKQNGKSFALNVTRENGSTEKYLINTDKGYVLRE
jgi:hypothetical protein